MFFYLSLFIVPGLKLMMGFARKSLLSFFVGTQHPSPELLFGVWTVHCLACNVARFGKETSTNWLWGERLRSEKQNLICEEEKDFGRNKQRIDCEEKYFGRNKQNLIVRKKTLEETKKKLIVRKKTCKPFLLLLL